MGRIEYPCLQRANKEERDQFLRSLLKKFNGEKPNALPSGSWCNIKEAADKLQVHFQTLQRLRKDGLLQPRLHYIQVTNTRTSPILWNIDQIMLRMADFAAPVSGGGK